MAINFEALLYTFNLDSCPFLTNSIALVAVLFVRIYIVQINTQEAKLKNNCKNFENYVYSNQSCYLLISGTFLHFTFFVSIPLYLTTLNTSECLLNSTKEILNGL